MRGGVPKVKNFQIRTLPPREEKSWTVWPRGFSRLCLLIPSLPRLLDEGQSQSIQQVCFVVVAFC